ncbi:MAG: SAM-dependent methyltransferase [Geminicoccaceae bacterium]|nr:SAM-dependent methyltransferase [Geminicoccaceae bacterium]
MTGLAERLRKSLAFEGPMPLSRFLALAMAERSAGYYTTRDPLGAAGDFTTAPEISQCFGELVGAALAQAWLDRGAPAPVRLVELGPGRGTLLLDAFRATQRVADFHRAIELHLVEASPVLRALQAERLAAFAPRFHDRLETVPEGRPLLLIANEFFDVLPIRQFVRTADGWRERLVAADEHGRLGFVLAPHALSLPELGTDLREGTVVELSPARAALACEIGRRIAAAGGLALLVDYAKVGAVGDSLQAVRGHRRADPLEEPGNVDLSSRVDFDALARAARTQGAAVFGPIGQGAFLERLGIRARLARLAAGRPEPVARALAAGVRRLVDPEEMGTLFRVLAVTRSGEPVPPGFEPQELAA